MKNLNLDFPLLINGSSKEEESPVEISPSIPEGPRRVKMEKFLSFTLFLLLLVNSIGGNNDKEIRDIQSSVIGLHANFLNLNNKFEDIYNKLGRIDKHLQFLSDKHEQLEDKQMALYEYVHNTTNELKNQTAQIYKPNYMLPPAPGMVNPFYYNATHNYPDTSVYEERMRKKSIIFEETFSDGANWTSRWLPFYKLIGRYERFSLAESSKAIHSTTNGYYPISAEFPKSSNRDKNLFIQFSANFSAGVPCTSTATINLYNCLDAGERLTWNTKKLLRFQIGFCNSEMNVKFYHPDTEESISKSQGKFDMLSNSTTHVFTLFVRPNDTFTVYADGIEAFSDNFNWPFRYHGYEEICKVGFIYQQDVDYYVEFDNILLTTNMEVAESKRDEILHPAKIFMGPYAPGHSHSQNPHHGQYHG